MDNLIPEDNLIPGILEKSVLIVDSDEESRLAITDHLSAKGITVSHAETCEMALALLEGQSFDLILTGILIPEMGGIELARRIKEYMPEQAVIIVTSCDDVKNSIEAMRLHVNDYILKPVDLDELETRITNGIILSQVTKAKPDK